MQKRIALVLLLACASLSRGPPLEACPPASVNGTVGGQPMNAQDSASNVYSFDTASEVLVYIMNVANSCRC